MKIKIKELEAYKVASREEKESKLISAERGFDIPDALSDGIKKELEDFLLEKGRENKLSSMRSYLYPHKQLCQWMVERHTDLQSFYGADEKGLIHDARIWLGLKGKNLKQVRKNTATGNNVTEDAELIKYLRMILRYFNKLPESFDFTSDIWLVKIIPVKLKRIDPTRHVDTLNFSKIYQDKMRHEVKKIVLVKVQEQALSTVMAEISGMNFFSAYLKERYPEVGSLLDLNRDIIEDFLVYVNTEASGRKSYRTVLHHIKSMILTASLVYERKALQTLFYEDDIPTEPYRLYKYYSDAEFKRLTEAIVEMDVQVGRMLILHILLGTRISDTLTLKQDCLYQNDSGSWMIKIKQIKSGRSYCKPVNEDVIKLINASVQYTEMHFGKQKYIFVTEDNPAEPMQYSRVQYQIMAMIAKKDLRNDAGELFGVGTHLFRHNYGKTLTEAGVDDITCAKLLGHADTHSLRYYRGTTKDRMAEETLNVRKIFNDVISETVKEW